MTGRFERSVAGAAISIRLKSRTPQPGTGQRARLDLWQVGQTSLPAARSIRTQLVKFLPGLAILEIHPERHGPVPHRRPITDGGIRFRSVASRPAGVDACRPASRHGSRVSRPSSPEQSARLCGWSKQARAKPMSWRRIWCCRWAGDVGRRARAPGSSTRSWRPARSETLRLPLPAGAVGMADDYLLARRWADAIQGGCERSTTSRAQC